MDTRSYWLVNSNRSRVKRFIKNKTNKDQFLNICLLIQGNLLLHVANNPSVMTAKEEIKKDTVKKNSKN